jgi:LmbE family N-acetylglucosaminyl deacetylase
VIDRLLTTGTSLFLSPHLDDAVLSCGALIGALAERAKPVVATIFTESDPPPHTFAARSFLRRCAAGSAAELFAARRLEDETALRGIGAEFVHLGHPDALFRRRRVGPAECAGRLLPELAHRYPTYRFDIARGRVSRADRQLIARIAAQVTGLVDRVGAERIFCPLGVGRHVDHLIARTVGEQFPGQVIFYSDFPYNQAHHPEAGFLERHNLRAATWATGLAGKQRFIRDYGSQVGGLFPEEHIPAVQEIYYSRTF